MGPVPASGVSAVVLNLTVTAPTSAGYVTVYPDGSIRPTVSNLNFGKGETVPNLVIAPVGADGAIDMYNGSTGSAQLIADVSGYFLAGTAAASGTFTPVTPTRLLDTRLSSGGSKPAAHGTVRLQVDGVGPVPAANVSAVVLNVTVTAPTAPGFMTVYADETLTPTASNLNFSTGQTIGNLVIAPVGADGIVDLYDGSTGSTQVIADVFGYIAGTQPVPASPAVARSAGSAVPAGGMLALQVDGQAGIPAGGVSAVVLNLTVTDPKTGGYVNAFPGSTVRPFTSNVNFTTGLTVPNLAVVPVGADGKINLYNGAAGSVQLVADAFAYVTSSDGTMTLAGPDRLLDTRYGTGAYTISPAWLTEVNQYRLAAGLTAVSNQTAWDTGLAHHMNYLAKTPASYFTGQYQSLHTENPKSPYYTTDGAAEAARSDLFDGAYGWPELAFIDGWLSAPFHAIGMLRAQLTQVAFVSNPNTGDAGLDVIGGLDASQPRATAPILFPGPGMTTNLSTYGGEMPDPLQTCGWQSLAPVGLPLIAMLTSAPQTGLTASITGPGGAIQSTANGKLCVVDQNTYRSTDPIYGPTGKDILAGDHAVLLIARQPFQAGRYTARITQAGQTDISWSFNESN